MLFNDGVRIYVGTDLSRPVGLSTPEQGRDKSVPTGAVSAFICQLHYHVQCAMNCARYIVNRL